MAGKTLILRWGAVRRRRRGSLRVGLWPSPRPRARVILERRGHLPSRLCQFPGSLCTVAFPVYPTIGGALKTREQIIAKPANIASIWDTARHEGPQPSSPGCCGLACDLHASGRRNSATIMRPVLLLVGLLSATKAFISVSPARRPASTLLRAEEDGGGPKRSLADAISAFSKGAL